jgi:hypothetical protein
MERNDLILRNKAEVLLRKKTVLLEQIAVGETQVAKLLNEYERHVASTRAKAAAPDFVVPPTLAKAMEKKWRLPKGLFRNAFFWGLGASLLLGLLIMFGR